MPWLIALFDGSASVDGTLIHGRFPLRIVKSCSALDAQVLYVAALIAFPASVRAKLFGVILGVIGLTGLNILRLTALYFVGGHAPS